LPLQRVAPDVTAPETRDGYILHLTPPPEANSSGKPWDKPRAAAPADTGLEKIWVA